MKTPWETLAQLVILLISIISGTTVGFLVYWLLTSLAGAR